MKKSERVMQGSGEGLPKQGIKSTKEGKEKAEPVGKRNEISIRNSQIRKASCFKFEKRKLLGSTNCGVYYFTLAFYKGKCQDNRTEMDRLKEQPQLEVDWGCS